MIDGDTRERIIQLKNAATSAILGVLEENSSLLELEFEQYNKIRNFIRYTQNQALNRMLSILGDPTHVRMTRANAKG